MNILYAVLIGFGLTYALWIFYLAVMNLKRAKDAGQLSKTAKVLGTPVLICGYLLDIFVNVFVMSVVLLEMPDELTVTARLKRHKKSTGWRLHVVLWLEPLLDPYDPSGDHV